MTDRQEAGLTIEELARALAPELMQQVIDDSRRDAARMVRERLTEALVREMTSAPGADPAASPPPGTEPVEEAPAGQLPAPHARGTGDSAGPGRPVTASGWYVYGITRAEVAGALRHRPGIDGGEIDSVAVGRVAAVVSPVAVDGQWGFDPAGNVDMETLAPRARDHERILEEVLDRGPVLPLRFGVMYPAVDDIRRLLASEGEALEAELDRLTAHSEWGLTIRAEAASPLAPVHDISEAGRDYLDRRRREREASERRRDVAHRVREEIHARLMAASSAGVVLPASDADRSSLLRASYLVPDEAVAEFRGAAEAALADAPEDLRLAGDLTGPWPPYHFTRIRLGEGVSA